MSTGDLSNNIKKLRGKLKAIRYAEDLDVQGFAEGTPTAFLPIYHYAFTSYSPELAEKLLGKDIELFGKSDARFMEAIYKVLRDMFSYKPPITKEQFFAKGFVERKVIMCADILQLVKDKHMALNPAPSKTALKTGVRPRSAAEMKHLSLAGVPKTKSAGKSSPRQQDSTTSHLQSPPCQPPHVVNELVTEPVSPPLRHVAKAISHTNTIRHVVGHKGQTGSRVSHSPRDSIDELGQSHLHGEGEDMPRQVSALSSRTNFRAVRHVSVQSPPERSHSDTALPANRFTNDGSPEHLMRPTHMCINTPSISRVCTNSVEVVSMPRGQMDDVSIMEIRAPTSDSVLHAPVPQSEPEVQSQITNLYQTIEVLTEHVVKFDTTLKEVRQSSAMNLEAYLKPVQDKVDNLMARMVLLENRVSIIESKVDDVNRTTSTIQSEIVHPPVTMAIQPTTVLSMTDTNTNTNAPIDPGSSFAAELKSLQSSGHPSQLDRIQSLFGQSSDMSLNYSPIRKATNGVAGQMLSANEDTFAMEAEDDARRSSTPTFGGTLGSFGGDSSFNCNFNDTDTNDAVSRIRNMMMETKKLMTEKTEVPLLESSN